jgi:hypothetical protein
VRVGLVVALIAGCYRPGDVDPCAIAGAHCAIDADVGDGPHDSGSDGGGDGAPTCRGKLITVCPGTTDWSWGQAIDTNLCISYGGEVLQQGVNQPAVCAIRAAAIHLTSTVHVTGQFPLVLSGVTITIDSGASLDVSSTGGGLAGAGANYQQCTASNSAPIVGHDAGATANDGGGGAGGTLGGAGGNGGTGAGSVGGVGGIALGRDNPPTVVRGGCPGGNGGATMSNPGRGAGAGGGAVYLIATTSISIMGTIDASGAGAGDVLMSTGGGGGGSGGLIALDAPAITLAPAAQLFTLGGSGGSGGDTSNGATGHDPTGWMMYAAGGSGSGGAGGDGSSPLDGAPGSTPSFGGGGGGGGGAGYIEVFGPASLGGTQIGPPATFNPF